jgi:dephospho-CoA kinase
MPSKIFTVGLTGGIGSGKSTVADLLAVAGAALVDTDLIAHMLTSRDGRAIDHIAARMGQEFIAPDGSLNRAATRERVFSDSRAKQQLEEILHPMIQEEVDIALRSERVRNAGYAVLVVPLLFESSAYRRRTNRTLLVDCPVAVQLARVAARSGLGIDEVTRIICSQAPRALRLQLADDVICNNGNTDALWVQVEPLHQRYLGLQRSFG